MSAWLHADLLRQLHGVDALRLDGAEPVHWNDAHDQHEYSQRREHGEFAEVEVGSGWLVTSDFRGRRRASAPATAYKLAPRMTLMVATTAQPRLTLVKVLERMRNSPTKPLSIGRPTMAREAMTKKVAVRGSLAASPP